MRKHLTLVLSMALVFGFIPAPSGASYPDDPLVYYTLDGPCVLWDTRDAGGVLTPGIPRAFDVVGETKDLSGQGGVSDGCGIPGFSGGTPQTRAVLINVVAVNPSGGGNLRVYPADIGFSGGGIVNYQALAPNLNNSNAFVSPVRQDSEGGDITVEANGSSVHTRGIALGFFVATDFTAGDHGHEASDITSGILGNDRYDARAELAAAGHLSNANGDIAQNNGLHQQNLNADWLDGQDATAFASSVHGHSAASITSGILGNDRYDARAELAAAGHLSNANGDIAQNNGLHQQDLNADKVDGQHATSFASSGHLHGGVYAGVGSAENGYLPRWIGTALFKGSLFDTGSQVGIGTSSPSSKLDVNGTVTADWLEYSTDQQRFLAVPGAAFNYMPSLSAGVNPSHYVNGDGSIEYAFAGVPASGDFVTPVYLPDGAHITQMDVYFSDDSLVDFTVSLEETSLFGSSPTVVASTSTGAGACASNSCLVGADHGVSSTSPLVLWARGLQSTQLHTLDTHTLRGVVIHYEVTNPLP